MNKASNRAPPLRVRMTEGSGFAAMALTTAWLNATPGLGRNINVLLIHRALAFAFRPVATAAIAATQEVTDSREPAPARGIAPLIAWQVATDVTCTTLGVQTRALGAPVPTMRNAAAVDTLIDECQPTKNAIAAHYPVAKRRAARAAGVFPISAVESLVWRQVPLVDADGSEDGSTHVLRA